MWTISPISVQIRSDDFGPHDCFVDGELTVQFLDVFWFRSHINDRIDALRLLADLVREAPATPDVQVVDGATALGDHFQILLERGLNRTLLSVRIEDDHDLVLTHARTPPPLVSSGYGTAP